MPMNYVLQKLDELRETTEKSERLNLSFRVDTRKEICELKDRIKLLEEKTSEVKQESDNSKIANVKLTCDNSAFLQSLDEIEKKVDTIQDKINQLINKREKR